MNSERRAVVEGVLGVVQAVPPAACGKRLTRALEVMISGVVDREKRSLTAMEPYKDQASTRRNYELSQRSLSHLQKAQKALSDTDWETLIIALEDATTGAEFVKKGKKK